MTNTTGLITINYDKEQPTVMGRDLYEALEVKTAYKDWFPRMCEYGFEEGKDFNPLKNERLQIEGNRQVTRTVIDHQLTIPMAKEICMLQRSEKGKQFRQYFIQIEEQWNTPEAVMARALRFANKQLESIKERNSLLVLTVKEQDKQIQSLTPKATYYDNFIDNKLFTNIRNTATELQIKETDFVEKILLGKKYMYRDGKGNLRPYAQFTTKNTNKYTNKLFVLKDYCNTKNNHKGQQTFITPMGKAILHKVVELWKIEEEENKGN